MEKKNIISELISWVLYMAGGIAIAMIIITFLFRITVVKGESMNETLQNNQYLYIDLLSYRFKEPERGDIVICNYPGLSDTFIKRIVGLPGETIRITDSTVYINDVAGVDKWNGDHEISDMPPVKIPEGCYFVMGDNRINSKDSRDKTVNAISKDSIIGKAAFSIYPFNSFGKIEFKS